MFKPYNLCKNEAIAEGPKFSSLISVPLELYVIFQTYAHTSNFFFYTNGEYKLNFKVHELIFSSSCYKLIEDILHCLCNCPHSREFWLSLNIGCYQKQISQTDAKAVKLWLYEMECGVSSILFVTRLWYAWCWKKICYF